MIKLAAMAVMLIGYLAFLVEAVLFLGWLMGVV